MDNLRPDIVRIVLPQNEGMKRCIMSRRAIGYVIAGKKHIYNGDECSVAKAGDLFYLDVGSHWIENFPPKDGNYEHLIFYYPEDSIKKIASTLNYQFGVTFPQVYPKAYMVDKYVVYPAWGEVKIFCDGVYKMLCDSSNSTNTTLDLLATLMIHLVAQKEDCSINNHIVSCLHKGVEDFTTIVQDNIFTDITLVELARKCEKSPSAFKRKFQYYYNDTPHHYILSQRLKHASTLLVTTSLSIADIGERCVFANPSHFIRCFRTEYGVTPADFRNRNKRNVAQTDFNVY